MLSTPGETYPTLPLRAAVIALTAFAAVLVGRPALVSVVGSGSVEHTVGVLVLQYVVIAAAALVVARRWGRGTLAETVGLRVHPDDLRTGVRTALSGLAMIGGLALVLHHLGLRSSRGGGTPAAVAGSSFPAASTLAVTAVVMVVAAPLFEEVVFRGIVLRALEGWLPGPLAVVTQGGVFAAFHVEPGRGPANIDLLLTLGALGVLLGWTARRHGRLGPSLVAHSVHNVVAFAALINAGR